MPIALSNLKLHQLPENVAVPTYNRSQITAGIVHIGVGNFHRAHQAMYLERLFNVGQSTNWGIVGAGVLAPDLAVYEALKSQDWLTTLVTQKSSEASAQVIGSMIDFVNPTEPAALVARLIDPEIRIVSLTITEGGYFLDAGDRFDPSHPDMIRDSRQPSEPMTAFGIILSALQQRRNAGTAPFTVMSCDNIPHNGDVTRETVTGLARLSDAEFARWIDRTVAFPNSMVDRITPATGERERRVIADSFGMLDRAPVFSEEFVQWVLEDDFPLGRPALEKVGVTFVDDVTPYELMKIRILNAGHAVIAYAAGLLDIEYAHEAMSDTTIRAFLTKVERTEIIPTVPPVPSIDLHEYFDVVAERFSNPAINDTTRRLCYDGSNRQPKFVLPILQDRHETGGSIDGLALVCALWCRYCAGETETGLAIKPNDPNWINLQDAAIKSKSRSSHWLEQEGIYGSKLHRNLRFAKAFDSWLTALWSKGVRDTLKVYVG